MKICPNCGSKMGAEVNFCTNCGADIRNVALDNQQAQPQQPVQQAVQNMQQPQQPVNQNPVDPQQNAQYSNVTNPTQGQAESTINETLRRSAMKASEAVKNFDRENLWNWFVNSWKTPTVEQEGEKWYGIATLLLESILVVLAASYRFKQFINQKLYQTEVPSQLQNMIDSAVKSLSMDLWLLIILNFVGLILAIYVANKFIFGKAKNFFEVINKFTQYSNISVFTTLALVLYFFLGLDQTGLLVFLIFFTLFLYTISGAVIVLDGENKKNDPIYGLIIYIAISIIVVGLAFLFIKSQVFSQIQTIFNVNLNDVFNNLR